MTGFLVAGYAVLTPIAALLCMAMAHDEGHTKPAVAAAAITGLFLWPIGLVYQLGRIGYMAPKYLKPGFIELGRIGYMAPKYLKPGFIELKRTYWPTKAKLPEARIVR